MSTSTERELATLVAALRTAGEAAAVIAVTRQLSPPDIEAMRRMHTTLSGYHRIARELQGTSAPATARRSAHIVEFPAGRISGPVTHRWPSFTPPDGAA